MHFYIPAELKVVESHLTWIEQIIPFLERSMLDRSESLEDHIRFLETRDDNEREVIVADDELDEAYNEHYPKFCSVYASRLNAATKLVYLQEFDGALDQLKLLERIYDRVEPCHRAAFKYTVDALKWSIKVWKNLHAADKSTSNKEDKGELEVVEDSAILHSEWKQLQEDSKAKAVFKYLWGCLGYSLKIAENVMLPLHQEIVQLDPDYHVWYSVLYLTMRSTRRNSSRLQRGTLSRPCEREQQMCEEAYRRKPNIYLSIKDMALMLKDTLWGNDKTEEDWDSEEATYLRCRHLFQDALKIATERNQRKWMKKIQVYLAEYLLFGKGRHLDQVEGIRLFEQCLAENPGCTTVLHKIGNLYRYGAAAKSPDYVRKFRDWNLAEQFYRHALELKPTNFPCVKDYLILLHYRKKHVEYVEVIDWVINDMKREDEVADLKILWGCVMWIFNPYEKLDRKNRTEACESWLHVLIKLPDFAQNLFTAVCKPPFNIGKDRPAYINLHHLSSTLEWMHKNCPREDEDRLQAIRTFLKEATIAKG